MPTFLPFRSLMARMGSCAKARSTGMHTCSAVIGSPASSRRRHAAAIEARSRSRRGDICIQRPAARHVADIGKPFRAQQVLGDIRGRDADGRDPA